MKTNALTLLILTVFMGVGFAQAPLNKYYGKWTNTDRNTRSIENLEITKQGTDTYVQIYGSCSPTNCDWGKVMATVYSENVSQNPSSNTEYIKADFNPGFAKKTVIIRYNKSGILTAHTLTDFNQRESRKDYSSMDKLKKATSRATVATNCGPEDCITLNPKGPFKVVKNSQGTYSVVQGRHYAFSAPSPSQAKNIIELVKRYGFTKSCFIGRPDPSFTYLLSGKKASAVQPASSEDVISIDLNKIEVKRINGRWKIVDGSHWIFDFENNEKEARNAMCIIKKYGFNSVGYVGRPDPSFVYMVKSTSRLKNLSVINRRNVDLKSLKKQ